MVSLEYKVSNADLISGRDCKDSMVELDRSDVAEMLDGVSGGAGRIEDGEVVVFELELILLVGSSSCCEEEDDEDQKDRDGCDVRWCGRSDGWERCLKLVLLCPFVLSLIAPAVRGDDTDFMRR